MFQRPLAGITKVILSTNIAETAVTIDDVVMVINSGKVKENSYDPYTGVATLQSTWICKASERQRRGRAGRVRPGLCLHLYSRTRSAALADFQQPEIRRSPLDELCLQIKLLSAPSAGAAALSRPLPIADFFRKAVEPPVDQAVQQAIQLLKDIGALEEDESLTTLGRHLAVLPLPPRIGKMLLYALMFRCLDPVLTVACVGAYRDPFTIPIDVRPKACAAGLRDRRSIESPPVSSCSHQGDGQRPRSNTGWLRSSEACRTSWPPPPPTRASRPPGPTARSGSTATATTCPSRR